MMKLTILALSFLSLALAPVRAMDVLFSKPANISSVCGVIAASGGLNVVVAPRVDHPVTFTVSRVSAVEALELLCRAENLRLQRAGFVTGPPAYLVLPKDAAPFTALPPVAHPESATFVIPRAVPLANIFRLIGLRAGVNIVVGSAVDAEMALTLKSIDPIEAMELVAAANDLTVTEQKVGGQRTFLVARR